MAKSIQKRCSTSLVIREVKIKTTIRHYFTPTRITTIKRGKITSIGKDEYSSPHLSLEGYISRPPVDA